MSRESRTKAHRELLNQLGAIENINKVIEEMSELTQQLNDYKIYLMSGKEPKNFKQIFDERSDVGNSMEKLDVFFGFNEEGVESRMNDKMQRTLNRLHLSKK